MKVIKHWFLLWFFLLGKTQNLHIIYAVISLILSFIDIIGKEKVEGGFCQKSVVVITIWWRWSSLTLKPSIEANGMLNQHSVLLTRPLKTVISTSNIAILKVNHDIKPDDYRCKNLPPAMKVTLDIYPTIIWERKQSQIHLRDISDWSMTWVSLWEGR